MTDPAVAQTFPYYVEVEEGKLTNGAPVAVTPNNLFAMAPTVVVILTR